MGTIPAPNIAEMGGTIAAAPRNALAEYARVAALKQQTAASQQQMQQQQQSFPLEQEQRQQAIDAQKRQLADQDALTKTLAQYDPDKHTLADIPKLVTQNGGSGQAALSAQTGLATQKKTLNSLSDEQFAQEQKKADLIQGVHDQVSQAKPEQKQQVYQQGLETLGRAGVDISKEPPQYPGDDAFAQHLAPVRLHSAIVAEAQKDREVSAKELTAQAHEDQAKKLPAAEQEFQAYYQSKLAAKGQPPSAAAEFAARQEFAAIHRAPRNDQANADAIEAAAQSIAKMDPKDLTKLKDIASLRGDQRLLIYNRAKQLNPNFSTAEVDRKAKMVDKYTNGDEGKQLQSFGTFLEHAGEASNVVNDFRTTSIPLVNAPLNSIRSKFGDASYNRIVAALEPVRKEFEGFLLGGRALYADDRKNAEIILSENSSPAQIQAALKQMGHTVKARQNEMGNRFKNTVGASMEDVVGPMSDEALAGAKAIGLNMGGAKAAATIRARDPQGKLHEAPAGTALPQGWTLDK